MLLARVVAKDLAATLSRMAAVENDGAAREVPIGEVQAGAMIVVRPGGRRPVDGDGASGKAAVHQFAIAGESMVCDPSLVSRLAEWRLGRFEESGLRPGRGRLPEWQARLARRLISRGTIEAIQLIRLRRAVTYAATRSPFYRDLLRKGGVDPRAIRAPQDLAALPFTSDEDLAEPERFLCVPEDEIGHIFTTSGTTAEPKRIYFTFRDVERTLNLGAAALSVLTWSEGGPPCHIVAVIAFPQGLWIGSQQAQRAVERAGGLALAIGMPPPDHALKLIERFHPNVLITSPSYLGALTRCAVPAGRRGPIPNIILSGELLSTEREKSFAELWGASILNSYGMTEIGGGQALALPGCRALHLNDVHVFTEIVDPPTGEPRDRGELVFTTLARQAMPLVRYRSGDLGRWADCDCGLPLRSVILEARTGDMFVAGDLNLYGRRVAESIESVAGTSGRVEIGLDAVGLSDRITLNVERLPGRDVDEQTVRQALFAVYPELRSRLQVGALELRLEPVDDLDAMAKSFRIVDRRTPRRDRLEDAT